MDKNKHIFQFLKNIIPKKNNSGEIPSQHKKFGTFSGVFTPDVLTILGVIMYLRLGWVVGNAGFLGAVLIILLAKSITICTGLSMSSITTNIKIGSGGAYSIISKSLGLEAGGSIGIPLYISQTLSAALYIIGFTEAWIRLFPGHPAHVVSTVAWLFLLVVTYISADFAIKIQYLIMAVIAVSLVSFFLSPAQPVAEFVIIGKFEDAGFWRVFAIFFPAVTGIMAGANMSGDLKDPRKSIPLGTMTSIFVTMIIYISIAYFAARISTTEELVNNQMIMVDKALWGQAVIAGIIGATLSSALGSMLGAPRILQALSEQKTVPFSNIFEKKTLRNEPGNAIIFTGLIIITAILLGNLDFLASLITMFFLITYGMLNFVVFIQQTMSIISFRPALKVNRLIPLTGCIGCLIIMFLINPVFSLIAIVIIFAIYIWLGRRQLRPEAGDIRGGLFLTIAERAVRLAAKFPRHQITWKPDLLIPIEDPKAWSGPLLFIDNITYPSGSILAFTVKEQQTQDITNDLENLLQPLKKDILVNYTVVEDTDFLHGAKIVIQTLNASSFRPNILFLTLGKNGNKDNIIKELVRHAIKNELGIAILCQHPRVAFGMQKNVNLWLRDKSPNWHLGVLITLKIQLNWQGKINLVTVAEDRNDIERLHKFLEDLSDKTRMPSETEIKVLSGKFEDVVKSAPRADINIFGTGSDMLYDLMRNMPELTNSSCLFLKDSGSESAFA